MLMGAPKNGSSHKITVSATLAKLTQELLKTCDFHRSVEDILYILYLCFSFSKSFFQRLFSIDRLTLGLQPEYCIGLHGTTFYIFISRKINHTLRISSIVLYLLIRVQDCAFEASNEL